MRIIWIAVALIVVGCVQTDTAYMKDPTTGKVVACGPYNIGQRFGGEYGATLERGCIDDYAKQGYVRVPGPNSKCQPALRPRLPLSNAPLARGSCLPFGRGSFVRLRRPAQHVLEYGVAALVVFVAHRGRIAWLSAHCRKQAGESTG